MGRVAQQLGTKPGLATAVSVNLVLPLVAATVGYAVLGSVASLIKSRLATA